ncbi:MAG: hypothetical protein IPJ75_15100 [Ignavibacteriales bacterium]|nr:hypothetical protein [Ignavibacteriales bacterium]
MHKMLFSITILLSVGLIFSGCCKCEESSESGTGSNVNNQIMGEGFINIEGTEAWIDLMPGGPAGFMFTGEATVAAWERPEFDSLKCRDAVILIDGKEVTKFPFVIENNGDKLQKPGKSSNISVRFNSKERNKSEGLMDAGKISIKLNIEYKGKMLTGIIDGVEVKRTY